MGFMKILSIEPIRNFIYDNNSKIKILLGSRRIGKTVALCFSTLRDIQIDKESEIVYCCNHQTQLKYIEKTLKDLCLIYDYKYKKTSYGLLIEDSTVYLKTINEILQGDLRGTKLKHLKIDEPSFSLNTLKKLLEMFKISSLWIDDESTISIAGTTQLTKELTSNINISRYIAKATEVDFLQKEIDKLKNIMDKKMYKKEILLELNNDPFDIFF